MTSNKQIEVEKKVKLEPHHIEQIEREGTFVKEVQFRDTYFDRADFYLTTQNIWLRQRENQFELKVGVKGTGGSIDRYEEITNEQKILAYLGLHFSNSMSDTFSQASITPFSSFITQRKRYQLGEFSIDIDVADFGDLTYRIAEFELLVSDTEQAKKAEKKIQDLLQRMKIDISTIMPAKLTYYLYHKRYEHYQALVDHRVIKPMNPEI